MPPVIFRGGVQAKYAWFSSSLQYSYTAEQFSDATNAKTSPVGTIGIVPSYSVADWNNRIAYKKFAIGFGINNLFDEKYFIRRSTSYPGPGILTAEPRNAYATLELVF